MNFSESYKKIICEPGTYFICMPDGDIISDISKLANKRKISIYPGSWNPLHEGHKWIYSNISSEDFKLFEIFIHRWDKPHLDEETVKARVEQFSGYAPIMVSNVARFVEKAGLLYPHEATWHVGIDTIQRMKLDYGEIGISGLRGTFQVYDRKLKEKVESYPDGFQFKPKNVNRADKQPPENLLDISSTKIRNGTYNAT